MFIVAKGHVAKKQTKAAAAPKKHAGPKKTPKNIKKTSGAKGKRVAKKGGKKPASKRVAKK